MRASARTPSGAAMQVLAMHAGFTTPLRSVSARPRPNRRVVTRASQDDCARPGGSASSPNRRANLVFFEVSYYAECGKEFGKEFGAWL